MRLRANHIALTLLGAASAIALLPAIAQRAPESILPPGFGDAPAAPANDTAPRPEPERNAPDRPAPGDVPGLALDLPDTPADGGGDAIGEVVADLPENALLAEIVPPDLPPAARRSLDRVGLLAQADGGLGEAGFGSFDGRFLASVMATMKVPVASRWAAIVLRRALLSDVTVPAGIDGADWVAERAWLLVRMGEADMARALVSRVDAENFTPRLREIGLQTALATADPAAVCGYADAGAASSDLPAWPLAQAMCAGLSGEPGRASALIDRVRDTRGAGGIDVLLAEKVIGAGSNTRRAVNIQWDGVDRLSAWRFGLATATGLTIPARLYATAGPQVQAWVARAPLLPLATRVRAAERAAELGVLSAGALVDVHSAIWDTADPAERAALPGERLRGAYRDGDAVARLVALGRVWGDEDTVAYAQLIVTARASALVAPSASFAGADVDRLLASMMSAGLDIQAARWREAVGDGTLGQALLAVGAPRPLSGFGAAQVRALEGGDNRRAQFLTAGLAGLGRLSEGDINDLAGRYAVPVGRTDSWTRAIDRAVAERAPAAVALIAAAGMQTGSWEAVPPHVLYRVVRSLRAVGLEPEARMIAAEAVSRVAD